MAERRRPWRPRRPRRAEGEIALTAVLAFAIAAATWPLSAVIEPGDWVIVAGLLSGVLLMIGFALRRARIPNAAVSALLAVAWIAGVTLIYLPEDALLRFIPTDATVGQVVLAVQETMRQIVESAPPMEATTPVVLLVAAAVGILTIVLDHVVITARMPVLAIVALVAVWLIPFVVTASPADVPAFVLLGTAALALVRAETSTRERAAIDRPAGGVTGVALALGAGAVVFALLAAPALPVSSLLTGRGGTGSAATIDASLDLGDDLRRPAPQPVLTVRSTASSIPYLRVATLSVFEGDVWQPDQLASVPLGEGAMEPVIVDEGIVLDDEATDVEVVQLSSALLPVPFPAIEASGMSGQWRSVPFNRTVIGVDASAQGQRYTVQTQTPQPTLEQIQAAEAVLGDTPVPLDSVPEDLPPVIAQTAAEVVAGAETDYDRLIALQDWFRGGEFTYSLDAPVEGGFDGSGAEAIARFLEVRAGYCVHFASAFALMARSLDMPARIVVGFLPGPVDVVDGERVSDVSTDQFHAWPEVYFEGIGWVGFEPTTGLGTATRFEPESVDAPGDGPEETPEVVAPTDAVDPTVLPEDPSFADEPADAGRSATQGDAGPILLTVGIVVVVALLPFGLRALRVLVLRQRARAGAVGAAWRLVRETAVDLGAPVPGAETPRAFGARIVADLGAPPEETGRLVDAVERASYSRSGRVDAAEVLADAERVRAGMLAAATPSVRIGAALLPRSLVIAPGADTE